VRRLLHAGANANKADDHGNGPLWTACFQSMTSSAPPSQSEIVSILLRAGADPDAKNRYGRSPRELMILGGRADILQ
jgi:ankyrin repeat protein